MQGHALSSEVLKDGCGVGEMTECQAGLRGLRGSC